MGKALYTVDPVFNVKGVKETSSIKVLLVDDEKSLLDQTEKLIDEFDLEIEVDTALSASKALEMLDEQDFDAVVSAYQMSSMDGIEFLEVLREERENDIPFIMLTGKGKEKVAMKAMNLGADRYLPKVGEPKSWYDILAKEIEQEVKQFKTEKQILESEERYRKLFESAQDGMLIIDAENGIIQDVNARLQKITGYSEEVLVGKKIWELDTFENIVDRKKDFQQFCEEGSIREENKQLKTKDGEEVRVEFVSNIYEVGGKKVIQLDVRKLSKRRKAEEAIKEGEDKYKKLFHASPDLTYFLDKYGVFKEVNEAGLKILGYEREEIIGKHFSDLSFLPPETKEKITEKVKRRIQGKDVKPYVIEAEKKNGERIYAEVNSSLVKENGEPVGSIGIVRNTTERKEAEEELEESRSRLKRSQELAKVGSWEMDVETGDLTWSDETYRIFEIPKNESIDYQGFLDKVHPDDRDLVDDKLQEVLEEGGRKRLEHRIIVNEDTKWVREIAEVSYDEEGRPLKAKGSIQDITERKKAEEELKESSSRLKRSQELAKVGSWELDPKTKKFTWSDEIYNIFEMPKNGPIDFQKFLDKVHPDDRDLVDYELQETFEYGGRDSLEHRIMVNDDIKWVREIADVNLDEDGNILEVRGSLQDITEQKEAKERLEKSEQRYRRLFESAQNGILILDAETGKIEDTNPYLEDLLGYTEEELEGNEMWKIGPLTIIADTKEEFEEIIEKDKIHYEDIHLETKEGREVPVEMVINTYQAGGEKSVQCKIIDKSAKKKRQSLQEAVMRFRKLSEASPNAIILVNKDTGVIKDVNQVTEELLDMERKDIIGKDYLDLHPEDVKEEIEGILSQLEEEETRNSRELQIIDSNDEKIPVKMRTSSLVLGDEEIIYFVLNDISKRKEAEEREEFLHSLLRHDLRNKIHISKGNLDLLKESGLSEENQEFLDDALESYEEGMDIIEKVRNLKKLGKDEVKEVSIGGGILRRSVDQYKSEAQSKGMEIELEMNDVSAKVNGGELLPEVFSNLISNSIKHSYADKILVSVEEDEEEVICTVEDNGDGIPQEKKDEIFEKGFTTVNSSSGLGLYLVKDIVEHYGGCVEVKDSELGGARFDVHLQKV